MMKSIVYKALIPAILILFIISNTHGQGCGKKLFCDLELDEDMDYRGQSTYAYLYPGDTVRTKTVIYSGQFYDIFVCGDPVLGSIELNIIRPHRKFRNVVSDIQETEEIVYETDEYGEYIYDEYGDYVEKERKIIYDTTWVKERYIEEELLYNNMNNKEGSIRWKKLAQKTHTIILEVIVPDNGSEGCADLFVGHKSRQKNSFRR